MRAFTRQADLGTLDLPSILVCGDRDRHVPLRNHLTTQQAIPRCGLQVYFDVGHVPFVETRDRCAADVARFLSELDLVRPSPFGTVFSRTSRSSCGTRSRERSSLQIAPDVVPLAGTRAGASTS